MKYNIFKEKIIKDVLSATINRRTALKFDDERWTVSLIVYEDLDYESFITDVKRNRKGDIVGLVRSSYSYDEDVVHFTISEAIEVLYFFVSMNLITSFDDIALNYTTDFENIESILYL